MDEQLRTENLVSDRIRKFVQAKTEMLAKKADEQDKLREKRVEALEKEREDIHHNREEEEREITRMHQLILQEAEEKGKRDREEKDR